MSSGRRARWIGSAGARQSQRQETERSSRKGPVHDWVMQITLWKRKAWEYLVRHMKLSTSPSSPSDQLAALRASLAHFEQSPDFGDAESVAAIRRHLVVRIREAEGAVRRPPWVRVEEAA